MEGTIKKIIEDRYGVKGEYSLLVGYQDLNYLISTANREKFVLKISRDPGEVDFIKSQSRLLDHLQNQGFQGRVPCLVRSLTGEPMVETILEASPVNIRLFKFIDGKFLAESKPESGFYKTLGAFFGELDRTLSDYHDPVLQCRTHEWDLARVLELSEDLPMIRDHETRRLTAYFLMKYREEVLPVYHKLPRQLIHSDGNDWNILLDEQASAGEGNTGISGILDFGDMVYAPRIQELAIVMAYALMGAEEMEPAYQNLVEGFRQYIPLDQIEINVLPHLTAARWCQTMIMAARQEKINPGSAYHQVSVEGARKMLKKWVKRNLVEMGEMVEMVELVERRYGYFSRALSLSYPKPIHMTGAAFQYMFSADGKTYLDCVNNIPHVGHCHPRVVEAGQRQMARLNTNTRYLYRSLENYAGKLLSKFPPSLNKVFFVNSGSAATDLAVRLIKAHTGRESFAVLDHAYHGNTQSAVSLSPYKFNRKGGKGKPDQTQIIGLPHGEAGPGLEDFGKLSGIGAFFAEPIPGCAGQVMLNRTYMQTLYREVRAQGGVCVSDEVQTGFGRVGHAFWGYELYDVVPDLVLLGKPMGNGHPMGAVVCTAEIAKSFETGMEFFSSFGGNPVSCEIGLAVLEIIEEEELQENARKVGDYLLNELSDIFLSPGHASRVTRHVSDVRGSGLFLGIEFVKDPATMEPDPVAAREIVYEMKDRGFLLSTDGPHDNVIKFKPPICFTLENARELVENFRSIQDK